MAMFDPFGSNGGRSGRRGGRTRSRRLAVAVAAAALGLAGLPAASAFALPSNCAQNVLTVTCTYSSGTHTFAIPKGVSTVHVVAVGARGGASAPNSAGFPAVAGGFGGRVTGDVSVTPGESIFAVVGGNGGLGTGGSNGGGDGIAALSGGGGGASDVRTSQSDLDSRLIVAAGGGGGGGNGAFYAVGGAGGDAGFGGGDGTDYGGSCGGDPCFARGGDGGGAGTASAGGDGGAGGHWADAGLLGFSGADGGLGSGGNAIVGESPGRMGGGGGGLYGGGSGGDGGRFDGANSEDSQGGGGGGGGGSNLVPAGGTSAVDSTGNSLITISYTVPVSVSPSSIDFGSQAIGSTSAARTVTLSNSGSAAIAVASVDLVGVNPGDFAISADGCSGKSVAAGGQCTVQVAFAPTATGARSASLRIVDDGSDGPRLVSLAGVGTTLADVRVVISGPASAPTNSQNTYAITVSNVGPSTALNVVMTAQVPNGTKYVGLTTTQGSCSHPASGATSGTITCSFGNLATGSPAVGTVTLKITLNGKGGSIVNVASAYSTGGGSTPDPNLANNVASYSTIISKK